MERSVLARPSRSGRLRAGDRPPAKKPTDETVAKATATTSDEDAAAADMSPTVKVADREIRPPSAYEKRRPEPRQGRHRCVGALRHDAGRARPRRGDVEDADAAIRLREALTKGAGRVQGIDVVGFDTETKPVFVAGRPPNDVALVQLAGRGPIVLCASTWMYSRFVETTARGRVGAEGRRRMRGRRTDAERAASGLDKGQLPEIDKIAKVKFPNLKACGLRSLVAILARKRMSKGQQTQTGACAVPPRHGALRGQRRRGGAAVFCKPPVPRPMFRPILHSFCPARPLLPPFSSSLRPRFFDGS